MNSPRLAPLTLAEVEDSGLRSVIDRAAETKSPPQSWYLTMGHNSEVAKEFARYWDMLHRGGNVPHRIKELCRLQIAQMIGCEFCARQTSPPASITDEERLSCALPNWEHPDAATRAALHLARTLVLDDGRDDEVYSELRIHYNESDIVELCAFFMLTMGGNRMAKSWGIERHADGISSIPVGVMSVKA